jgi:carbon catabolite-derepressing protein kinase
MHEIYNTLQVLGMQWKRKQCFDGPWDQDGRPIRNPPPGQTREQKQKERVNEEKQNQALFFVETRCKIDDVVVSFELNNKCPGEAADLLVLDTIPQIRMDLQLYRVDGSNYLVDFRNVGYYRSNNDPDDYALYRRPSDATDHTVAESLESRRSSVDGITIASPLKREAATTIPGGPGNETVEGKIMEVCSPFLFLEVACRLIVELASA